jgi:hypothetical protein
MVYAGNALSVSKTSVWDDGDYGSTSSSTSLTKTKKFVILITAVTAGKTAAEINDNTSCDSSAFVAPCVANVYWDKKIWFLQTTMVPTLVASTISAGSSSAIANCRMGTGGGFYAYTVQDSAFDLEIDGVSKPYTTTTTQIHFEKNYPCTLVGCSEPEHSFSSSMPFKVELTDGKSSPDCPRVVRFHEEALTFDATFKRTVD